VKLVFDVQGWDDYQHWVKHDRKRALRIAELLKDIARSPYEGVGKPESLKFDLSGWWSRRIDAGHRIIYIVVNDEIWVAQCRYHY